MTILATTTTIASSVAASAPQQRPVAARTKMLLEAPIFSTLWRLSAPNVLNLLALAGMITFDALFLGRLGPDALAGVSLAFPFVMLVIQSTNGGMGGGGSSAIARARRRTPRSGRCACLPRLRSVAGARRDLCRLHAARRAASVPRNGWTGRGAAGSAVLFQRDVRRRGVRVHGQFSRQRCTRHRQYDFPGERSRRQRRRACSHRAGADFRLGPARRWVPPALAGASSPPLPAAAWC